ncbi:hypothetical protein C8F01DRAFT_736427 [Mycena amicta]|nr:hypothetical protein C8F01DRAFT_736427 [Mycena amicta]
MARSLFVVAVAALGLVSVQAQVSALPQCAVGCANAASTKVGCATTDTACLCKTSFPSTVLQCADTTSCDAADQTKVSDILEQMCDIVSVSASGGSSGPVNPASSASLTETLPFSSSQIVTVTTTITSVSPPITTTFTTTAAITPSGPTIVPPPISPSLSVSSTSSPSLSASAPSSSSSTGTAIGARVNLGNICISVFLAGGFVGALLAL